MRRPLTVAAIASAVLSMPIAASAQVSNDPKPVTWSVLAGIESGTGTLKTDALRYAVGVAIQIRPPEPHFAFRADVSYHGGFPQNCGSFAVCGGGLEVLAWSADVLYRINNDSKNWSPYLLGGLALYALDQTSDLKPAHFGAHYGAGFEAGSKKSAKVFIEIRYLDLSQGGLLPISFGVRF